MWYHRKKRWYQTYSILRHLITQSMSSIKKKICSQRCLSIWKTYLATMILHHLFHRLSKRLRSRRFKGWWRIVRDCRVGDIWIKIKIKKKEMQVLKASMMEKILLRTEKNSWVSFIRNIEWIATLKQTHQPKVSDTVLTNPLAHARTSTTWMITTATTLWCQTFRSSTSLNNCSARYLNVTRRSMISANRTRGSSINVWLWKSI